MAQFSASSYYVDETEGQVIAIVNRERGGVGDVMVEYSVVAASAGKDDFVAAGGVLTWTDGDVASKTLTVDINNDAELEGDEEIHLFLSNPTGGLGLGRLSTSKIVIGGN